MEQRALPKPIVDDRQVAGLHRAPWMAGIAQLAERQVVVLDVTGSSPVARPSFSAGRRAAPERVRRMDIELPDRISAETIQRAGPAVTALHALLNRDALPTGLTVESLGALLTIMEGVAEAAAGDNADLSPSEAAERLRMARPSVMRLIGRGELSSRKEGGHYVLSPRELRSFQTRLALVRRDASGVLTSMAEEFGF